MLGKVEGNPSEAEDQFVTTAPGSRPKLRPTKQANQRAASVTFLEAQAGAGGQDELAFFDFHAGKRIIANQ